MIRRPAVLPTPVKVHLIFFQLSKNRNMASQLLFISLSFIIKKCMISDKKKASEYSLFKDCSKVCQRRRGGNHSPVKVEK